MSFKSVYLFTLEQAERFKCREGRPKVNRLDGQWALWLIGLMVNRLDEVLWLIGLMVNRLNGQ